VDKWDLLVKAGLTGVGTVYKLKQKGSLTAHNGLMGTPVVFMPGLKLPYHISSGKDVKIVSPDFQLLLHAN